MLKRITAAAIACSLFFSAMTIVSAESETTAFPVSEQTWQYLEKNSPGSNSIIAYSLGARPIREDAKQNFTAELEKEMLSNFSSAEQLERMILLLVKLGENPTDYKSKDFISLLSSHKDPYENGLISACGALMAYDAAHSSIPETARNSPTNLVDYIVSSQHRAGGFSPTTGRSPDVFSTALVLTALAPHKATPYVNSSINKALDWLGFQQNEDGSFPAENPDCIKTAAVLTAIRTLGISNEDSRFTKNGHNLLAAMDQFVNTDGGFTQTVGGKSSVDVTEAAVIALYTDALGIAPYLPPESYPNYVEPEQDGIIVYFQFVLGFLAILAIIYFLLILTTKIGKKWGHVKLPFINNQEIKKDVKSENDGKTLEIHIPMKAEMTNFDAIYQEENKLKKQPKKPAD